MRRNYMTEIPRLLSDKVIASALNSLRSNWEGVEMKPSIHFPDVDRGCRQYEVIDKTNQREQNLCQIMIYFDWIQNYICGDLDTTGHVYQEKEVEEIIEKAKELRARAEGIKILLVAIIRERIGCWGEKEIGINDNFEIVVSETNKRGMFEHVITDVDGVILNRMPMYGEVFSSLLSANFGLDSGEAKNFFFSTAGSPLKDQLSGFLEKCSLDFTDFDINRLVSEFFSKTKRHPVLLFPNIHPVIREIREKCKTLSVTSGSNTAELISIFNEQRLPYDIILGSDEIEKSREHIKKFAKYFATSLSQYCRTALYIGDGPVDMEIAKKCGIYAVGITTTVSREELFAAGADNVIDRIEEVLKFF